MKISLAIFAIIAVLFWGYNRFEREKDKRELRKSTHIFEGEILELRCGKRDNIKFKINERVFNERIYLSAEECSELSSQVTIGVKIDSKGNVVFADNNYNDWSEAESVAIVILVLFLVSMITYYVVIPEIRKKERNKKGARKKARHN